MSKKVIILGVAGQTGSYMAEFLLKNTDVEVYGAIRTTSTSQKNIEACLQNKRFSVVRADLNDENSINYLVSKIQPDYFINFAAQSSVGDSWESPEKTFNLNTNGVIRCLQALKKYAPHCRFFNSGTAEEFGEALFLPQNESHPLQARSPYAASKIAARQVIRTYRDGYGMYAIQGTLYNHESERRAEKFISRKISLGVARIAKAIERGEKFEPIVVGNLEILRDFSHAEDIVLGIWIMLNQDQTTSWDIKPSADVRINARKLAENLKEYILASGEAHSIRELVEEAFKVAEIVIKDVNPAKMPPALSIAGEQVNYTTEAGVPLVVSCQSLFRPAEVHGMQGDSAMARNLLAWYPAVNFQTLVRRMVEHDMAALNK